MSLPQFPCSTVALLVTLPLLLSGCSRPGDAPAAAAAASSATTASAPTAAAPAPAVSVTTVRAVQRDVAVNLQATGTVTPLSVVDVRPQVTSVVTQVHVKEGQFVKKGEPLFTLDSRSDEANVAKARAQLAKDEAALADARRQLARSQQLFAQNFVSQGAVDTSQTLVDSQLAAVAADRAAVEAARVPLLYARVTAPSAGRIGAIAVFPGSAVQANITSLLSITQLNPMAVAFSLPQRHLADVMAAMQRGAAPVEALLPESKKALQGRLQFIDSSVDAGSGTVKVKAYFDNPDGQLWPGAFVNVAITVKTLKDAVVVPQATVIESARGSIVYVVDEAAKAVLRPVKLLHATDGEAALSGIRAGDKVVLDGRQNLRPGVSVVERSPDAKGKKASVPADKTDAAAGAPTGAPAGDAAASATAPGRTDKASDQKSTP